MKRQKPRPGRKDHPAAPRATAPDANASGVLEQARQLVALGRQDEALGLLTSLAQASQPAPEALMALGRLYMDRQEFAQAASIFRRLTGQSPGDPGLRNSLGMALVMAGDRQRALPELEAAARLAPQEPIFQFNLGKYHILMEDYARGRQVLEKLLPQAPAQMRDQTLGYLNQCLARLGLPSVAASQPPAPAAPAAPAAAPVVAPPPSPHTSPAPPATPAMDMLLCCGQGLDSFVSGLIAGLAPQVRVEKVVSERGDDFLAAIARHQTVWIEWGNELAEFLTTQGARALKGKRVILRIHAYEVMQGLADRIDFRQVTDLMFVCAGMRDLLLERRPEIAQQVERIHVIPNGIDTRRFQLAPRPPGQELAYVGYLNFKKGPMVLMHALQALRRADGRCRLHVAGAFQDQYSETACHHFLASNDLASAVRFYGWVNDVQAWLADKNAIICTSLSESQGLGLMEALAMGVKPLIYNFHTARHIYPRQWLWNNLEELSELLHAPHDPREGRRFVEENYSLDLQVSRLQEMLFQKRQMVFDGPRIELAGPPAMPPQCASPDLSPRGEANKRHGLELRQGGWLKEATVYLERAWSQSRHQDRQVLEGLLACHLERARYWEVAQVFKEQGLAAAARGDYETMLSAFYEVYYHVYKHTGSYRWQRFDPALDTVLRLVAPRVEPLPGFEALAGRLDPAKLKVALALDSFDLSWATVKRFVDIGKRLDKSRFEVIFLTRMEMQESWRPALEALAAHGCHLLCRPGQDHYAKTREFLHILRRVGCDALLLNTQFLTPWYDLLALAGAARKVVKFLSQGGGRESSSDLAVSVLGGDLADEVAQGVHLGPAYVSEIARVRGPRQSPAGQLKALCVGRPVKFANNNQFWQVLRQALAALPGLSITIVGSRAAEIFGGQESPLERLSCLGFRPDVQELLADYDVLIDTWPSGGGCTVREAHACGLPVISCRTPWDEHYQEGASFYGGLDDFIHPELRLEKFTAGALIERLGRLAGDPDYYRRVQDQCATLPVLTPEQFTQGLAETLLKLCGRAPAGTPPTARQG
ncbi:MAG: glycosyltransferase [Pseudomonadota bacterium]